MDIPADADGGNPGTLEDLLRAGPSILDEMMALSQPAPAPVSRANQISANQRGYRAALSNRSRGVQPFAGPGSMTRAIGVNDWAIGTNTTGDGRGNVVRDNMRHFGIVGTRSR
jgi:ribosome modulation factor